MSKDNYNAAGVPWFSSSDTPPIRPKEVKEVPEWVKEKKVRHGQKIQFIYDHIRKEWKRGDRFKVNVPDCMKTEGTIFRHEGRTGIFLEMKTVGCYKMVMVDWLDTKNKIMMGVVEFYNYADKLPVEDNDMRHPDPAEEANPEQ